MFNVTCVKVLRGPMVPTIKLQFFLSFRVSYNLHHILRCPHTPRQERSETVIITLVLRYMRLALVNCKLYLFELSLLVTLVNSLT